MLFATSKFFTNKSFNEAQTSGQNQLHPEKFGIQRFDGICSPPSHDFFVDDCIHVVNFQSINVQEARSVRTSITLNSQRLGRESGGSPQNTSKLTNHGYDAPSNTVSAGTGTGKTNKQTNIQHIFLMSFNQRVSAKCRW